MQGYLSKHDIESLITKYFREMNANSTPQLVTPPPDLTTIADAIREGLNSIATSIEVVGELEDRRIRDLNKEPLKSPYQDIPF